MATNRRACDIDYSILHKTGKKVPISRSTSRNEAAVTDIMTESNDKQASTHILQTEESCEEAISDFFEENSLADAYTLEEINSNVIEIKNLRTEYKRLHRQLKPLVEEYDTNMKPKYDEICEKITNYIKDSKIEKRNRIDKLQQQETVDRKLAADACTEKELKLQKEKTKQEDQICGIKTRNLKKR